MDLQKLKSNFFYIFLIFGTRLDFVGTRISAQKCFKTLLLLTKKERKKKAGKIMNDVRLEKAVSVTDLDVADKFGCL